MCLGVPMQVVSVEGDLVVAEIDGVVREASRAMIDDPLSPGDYVIVHAGFVISKLDTEEAEETLRIMREVFTPEDMA
ncbi:MAG: HypC/HybG/HupF family hydrogenase formation chaperone [Desulfuromonadia bacterium]